MVLKVAVLCETFPGEHRVALIPASAAALAKAGIEVLVETNAGLAAGFSDHQYTEKGAVIITRQQLSEADVVVMIRCAGANRGATSIYQPRPGQILIGLCDPLGDPASISAMAGTRATILSLELIPRITRAQSMDVLSSQATVTGYGAVIMAANTLPKMFPMLMTAAGTVTSARAFIIGAGVAGLQAIAIARKLGAVVHAYDVRPACREQVESLGGKFVELQLDTAASEDKGGYARVMDDEFYRRQRELLSSVVSQSDVVITTALIPGKKSPLLVTADAVKSMAPGSVVVDLAAERGGNCELTVADQTVIRHGVTILGPTNIPARHAYHASLMFSNNVTKFLQNMVHKGELTLDTSDEIIRETLLTRDGDIVHTRVRSLLTG